MIIRLVASMVGPAPAQSARCDHWRCHRLIQVSPSCLFLWQRSDCSPVLRPPDDDSRISSLFTHLANLYLLSSGFRKTVTARRVEEMLPIIADFAAVSGSPARAEIMASPRSAAAMWLQGLIQFGKFTGALAIQVRVFMIILWPAHHGR